MPSATDLCSFTTDGVLSWNNSIYSEDASSVVDILDVGYEGTQIVVTGLTNAATIKCIDVSKSNKQELYTYNETINQYSLINYYFNSTPVSLALTAIAAEATDLN